VRWCGGLTRGKRPLRRGRDAGGALREDRGQEKIVRATASTLVALIFIAIPLAPSAAETVGCVLSGARAGSTTAHGEVNKPKATDTFNVTGKGGGLEVTSAFWPRSGHALATGVEYTDANSTGAVAVRGKSQQWQADGGLFTPGTTYSFKLDALGAPDGLYGTRAAHGTLRARLKSGARSAGGEIVLECTF
jgi:hypothetical protein